MEEKSYKIIKLTVKNHAGALSHITGLFSRRAFNMEGILCGPIGDGTKSRIFLLVNNDGRLEQIEKQLEKLYDVLEVVTGETTDRALFTRIVEDLNFIPEEVRK